MKVLAIVSGGLDSTVLAYTLSRGGDLALLSFNYGQRHSRELDYAQHTAQKLGARWDMIDLTGVGNLLEGNALSDNGVAIPEGHYADASMRLTVVPNRNAIMLSCAVAVAATRGYDAVAFGVHGGDHFIYPDCRPDFLKAFQVMIDRALGEWWKVRVLAPFINKTKADIVTIGAQVGVPFADTWSCYKGGAIHCGKCGTCVERREAFAVAGVADPTQYEGE